MCQWEENQTFVHCWVVSGVCVCAWTLNMCVCGVVRQSRAREGSGFTTVVLNIPDIVMCFWAWCISSTAKYTETQGRNENGHLSYVKNAWVSVLLHICWNESAFHFVGVPFIWYLNQLSEGGIPQPHFLLHIEFIFNNLCKILKKNIYPIQHLRLKRHHSLILFCSQTYRLTF